MQKDGGCAERWWLYAERQRLNATPHETIQDGGSACRKMVAGCRKMVPAHFLYFYHTGKRPLIFILLLMYELMQQKIGPLVKRN